MGNKHEKFSEDRTCSSGDMLADKHKDRHAHQNATYLDLGPPFLDRTSGDEIPPSLPIAGDSLYKHYGPV